VLDSNYGVQVVDLVLLDLMLILLLDLLEHMHLLLLRFVQDNVSVCVLVVLIVVIKLQVEEEEFQDVLLMLGMVTVYSVISVQKVGMELYYLGVVI
tara:strand:+ start:197 stop:484 length:288 start_codon:yes stop_codon:yes gene_type:complete